MCRGREDRRAGASPCLCPTAGEGEGPAQRRSPGREAQAGDPRGFLGTPVPCVAGRCSR